MMENERFASTLNDRHTFYDNHHHHHFDDDNYELDHDYDNGNHVRHHIKDAVRNKLYELKARYSDKISSNKAATNMVPPVSSEINGENNLIMNDENNNEINDEINGILDENISENDNEFAGTEHAVTGGAITSFGGPLMPSRTDIESTEQPATATPGRFDVSGVEGVEEAGMNSDFLGSYLGSFLDETWSMMNPMSMRNARNTNSEESVNANCN